MRRTAASCRQAGGGPRLAGATSSHSDGALGSPPTPEDDDQRRGGSLGFTPAAISSAGCLLEIEISSLCGGADLGIRRRAGLVSVFPAASAVVFLPRLCARLIQRPDESGSPGDWRGCLPGRRDLAPPLPSSSASMRERRRAFEHRKRTSHCRALFLRIPRCDLCRHTE
ncbi:hypothetical protein MRX96_010443 [Rhipicephalus microplus]